MKKYLYLIFMLSLFLNSNGYATVLGKGDVTTAWGVSEPSWGNNVSLCHGTGVDAFGSGAFNTKIDHTQWRKFLRGHLGETAVYYVAKKIVENGGYFCATVVDADRPKGCTQKPYTVYYNTATQHCFWACADGYFGENCTTQDQTKNLSDTPASEYNVHGTTAVKILGQNQTAGGNIRDSIDSFFTTGDDSKQDCKDVNRVNFNSGKNQRIDYLLAIKYTESTNDEEITMIAQPMAVRAGGAKGCEDKGDNHAWPMVGFIGTARYVCPDGFMPNALKANKSCIRSTEKNRAIANMCAGEQKSKYDTNIHKTQNKSKSDKCQVIRCKNGGFSDKENLTCEPCTNAPKEGVNTSTGVCTKCETGKVFKNDDCTDARQLSKNVMKFGKGSNGTNDASTDIDEQCWAKDTPDEYETCILNTSGS